MTFDNPFFLLCFLIFIPLIIIDIIKNKNKQKLSAKLEKKLILSIFLFRLFLAFAIIALAGPRWGTGYAPSEFRRGLDIVYAIDVSRSMDLQDAQIEERLETRLERGLYIARASLKAVTGARYGVAIGRNRGYLAIPLVFDNDAPLVFFESVDVQSITGRSTNLEALVDAAADAFQNTSPAQRVIILISDGEEHSGSLRNAVNRCIRENIIVTTVAVGSDEGRLIQARLDDPSAPQVISRRDTAVMRSAAERTGGIFIDANREDAAQVLSSHLLSLAQETELIHRREESRQRRVLFITLALFSYAASKLVTRSRKAANLRASIIGIPLIVIHFGIIFSVLLTLTSCSEGKLLILQGNYLFARGRFEDAVVPFLEALNHENAAPYAEYGLGLIFHMMENAQTALQRYANSQNLLQVFPTHEHRELRFRIFYNSGVVFFEEGDYHAAAASFSDALRIIPGRIEAKRNLELSLLSILREENTQSPPDYRQEQREILFEYLREEEQQRWRSREWIEEEFTGMDF
ncbi:MAG: VWA domain-containing protein [Treponema sp.]|nr:VWA domain-containing protein [Treponema sp.]